VREGARDPDLQRRIQPRSVAASRTPEPNGGALPGVGGDRGRRPSAVAEAVTGLRLHPATHPWDGFHVAVQQAGLGWAADSYDEVRPGRAALRATALVSREATRRSLG
jgi:hypothetical protein